MHSVKATYFMWWQKDLGQYVRVAFYKEIFESFCNDHCRWTLETLVVPVAATVSADETEALKAEITKAVEKVQEAGEWTPLSDF